MMGDMADYVIDQGFEVLAAHNAGMCSDWCEYCEALAAKRTARKRRGNMDGVIHDGGEAPPPASKARRGFAAMDDATRRDIARRGGRAAHAAGTAHEWDRDTAKHAGSKGGKASSADRERMSEIGRKGGKARVAAAKARKEASK